MNLKPKNGHILFVECKDPANLIGEGGIEIANLGYKGQTIGVVIAVDEDGPADRPHLCKGGDVIYCRDPDVTGVCKTDGGRDVYAVRECLIWAVADGVVAEKLPPALPSKEQFDGLIDASKARQVRNAKLLVPKKEIQLVQ